MDVKRPLTGGEASAAHPRIAVSSVPRPVVTGYGEDRADTATQGVIRGVVTAGGVPVVLPVVDPAMAAAQLDGADGLVLTGGQDLDLPATDVELDPHRWIDPARDRHEFALWTAAREAGLPVLGICRGLQLVNVALGGSLILHVEGHDAGGAHADRLHPVRVRPYGALAAAIGDGAPGVNTIHHQAIERLAPPLRPTAHSADGLIEAAELEDPWFVGVQWHPELMLDLPGGQPLFDALVIQARARSVR